MATLKEIAAICNVSAATVSKALNNAPDIGQETAARIREVARDLGYRPNAAARALKTNRTYNIGVLFSDMSGTGLSHEYFIHILNSVKKTAESRGYDITFINANIGGSHIHVVDHCRYRGCDGVVIADVNFTDPDVIELAASEIPIVSIDYSFEGSSAVISDNPSGIRDLVTYIYECGHRKIGFIYGDDTAVTRSRLAGFRKTCMSLGVPVREDWLIPARFHDTDACEKAIGAFLQHLHDMPTCILCPDDISIYGAIAALEHEGLSVPEDISLAGYDGIPLSQQLKPRLTTLHQDSYRLGAAAVEALLEAIEQPKTFIPQRILVPGQLMPGETVAKLMVL